MKRVLTVFGTRPEAVKLAPVILELEKHCDRFQNLVCVTAQHRVMLDQALEWFEIKPHYDLDLMQPDQGLAEFASRALVAVSELLQEVKPDLVLVQGDTTTVMIGALAAFYQHIPVGHVEAGLRTRNRYNPFPEEINRRMAGMLATYHFAPTERAASALRAEQVPEENIFITGNTVVDALLMTMRRAVNLELDFNLDGRRLILVTAHRRESFGVQFDPFASRCETWPSAMPTSILFTPCILTQCAQTRCTNPGRAATNSSTGAHALRTVCPSDGKSVFDINRLRRYPGRSTCIGKTCTSHAGDDRAIGGYRGRHGSSGGHRPRTNRLRGRTCAK